MMIFNKKRTQPISIICDVLLDPYIYYFLHASSETYHTSPMERRVKIASK
jgi:hypothetical protein